MWFLVILNALAKNIIPLIRQKLFLKKTRKGEWPLTSPTEGGSGGASPPAFTRTTITSKSPSEAVFIVVSVRHALTCIQVELIPPLFVRVYCNFFNGQPSR